MLELREQGCVLCKQGVAGSIPVTSTKFRFGLCAGSPPETETRCESLTKEEIDRTT